MRFTHPEFLWALTAISIPVLIHLFNFKRFKKVYFTNVRLIKELSEETRRQSRLRHLIILFIRILLITALVIAFAGPYIPVSEDKETLSGRKLVSIYLDNSFSMEMRDADNILLETAKSIIPRITETYSGDDLFRFMTTNDNPLHGHLMSAEEIISHSSEVNLSPEVRQLSAITDRFKEVPEEAQSLIQEIYLLTDLQKTSSDFNNFTSDSTTRIRILPFFAENNNNLYPDSCWFSSPINITGQTLTLKARIYNTSGKIVEKQTVQLYIDSKQKAVTTIDLPAEGYAVAEFTFVDQTAGTKTAEIRIADYPVTYDDSFFFTYTTIDKIKVLAINGNKENRYVNTLFENDSIFFYRSISTESLTLSYLRTFDLIILNETGTLGSGFSNELTNMCKQGKSIVIIPDLSSEGTMIETTFGFHLESNPDTARIRMNTPELHSDFYTGIFNPEELNGNELPDKTDMPYIRTHKRVTLNFPQSSDKLLTLANGDVFLWRRALGSGWVYGFSSPMNEQSGNYVSHALFVPVFYKIAFISTSTGMEYVTIGTDQGIAVKNNAELKRETVSIVSVNSDYSFIPGVETIDNQTFLHFYGNIGVSGFYQIASNGKIIHTFAANYNRQESNLLCYSASEAGEMLKENDIQGVSVIDTPPERISSTLQELNEGRKLWHYFVYLCLLFLLAEGLLLRMWK